MGKKYHFTLNVYESEVPDKSIERRRRLIAHQEEVNLGDAIEIFWRSKMKSAIFECPGNKYASVGSFASAIRQRIIDMGYKSDMFVVKKGEKVHVGKTKCYKDKLLI